MPLTFEAVLQWIALGQKVFAGGQKAWDAIKSALAAHGIEADTAELDKAIADADRRAALAKSEAKG